MSRLRYAAHLLSSLISATDLLPDIVEIEGRMLYVEGYTIQDMFQLTEAIENMREIVSFKISLNNGSVFMQIFLTQDVGDLYLEDGYVIDEVGNTEPLDPIEDLISDMELLL